MIPFPSLLSPRVVTVLISHIAPLSNIVTPFYIMPPNRDKHIMDEIKLLVKGGDRAENSLRPFKTVQKLYRHEKRVQAKSPEPLVLPGGAGV
jgi:hypothetical protein